MAEKQKTALSDKKMMMRAIKDSFIKLKPKTQAGNPVMLLVYLSAIMTTGLWLISLIFGIGDAPTGYTCAVAVILWFTVLFANFAEAIAEGRGKAQADSLRKAKKDVDAHKIPSPDQKERITVIPSTSLKKGDAILMCPSCGRRLDLTGSGKSYRCPQAHMTGLPECSNSKMDKVELEETVLACARNMVRFISDNLEKKKKVWLETSIQEEKLSTLASEKKRLSSRKMKLYSDYRMGSLTKDQYISELEITTKRIAEIDQCIPEIENEIEEARKKIEEAGAKQAELNDIAALQSFDKNVLYKIIDKVYVYGGGRIEIIWKMDDIFFVGDKSKVIDVNEKKDE